MSLLRDMENNLFTHSVSTLSLLTPSSTFEVATVLMCCINYLLAYFFYLS